MFPLSCWLVSARRLNKLKIKASRITNPDRDLSQNKIVEFKASLIYAVSLGPAWIIKSRPCLKKQNQQQQKLAFAYLPMLGKGLAGSSVHRNAVSGTVINVSILVAWRGVLFGGTDIEDSCLQLTVKWFWQKVYVCRRETEWQRML